MHRPNRLLPTATASRRRVAGFTLIELMLVVVIIGIIAAIALPSYRDHVMRSRRAEAQNALSQINQAQERWRSNNASYAPDLATLYPNDGAPQLAHYTLSISRVSGQTDFVAGYEVHAVPRPGPQAADSACADMFVRVSGGQLYYRDGTMAASAVTSACWPQ